MSSESAKGGKYLIHVMLKRHLKDRLWGSHFSSIEWLLFLRMYGVHGCIIPRHESFAWPSMLSVVSRGWATARSSRTRKWHDSSSCRTLSTNRSDSRFAWLLLSFITAYLKPYQFALTTFLSLFGSLLNHTFILVVKKPIALVKHLGLIVLWTE